MVIFGENHKKKKMEVYELSPKDCPFYTLFIRWFPCWRMVVNHYNELTPKQTVKPKSKCHSNKSWILSINGMSLNLGSLLRAYLFEL